MEGIQLIINHPTILKNVFHKIQDGVAVIENKDNGYTYTYLNAEMKRIFGDWEGKQLSAVHSKKTTDQMNIAIEAAYLQGDKETEFFLPSPLSQAFTIYILKPAHSCLLFLPNQKHEKAKELHSYESIVEMSPDAIFVHNSKGKLVYVNSAALDLLGADYKSQLIGQSVDRFFQDETASVNLFVNDLGAEEYRFLSSVERKINRLDGKVLEVEVHGSKVSFEGEPVFQTVARNITERRIQQNQLEEMAYYDQLTKVANRRYLLDHLQLKIDEDKETVFSLLFIDLDNFKKINDQYGHPIGDEVLVIFTKRIRQLLRESDTISRIGGDEFVVLLSDLTSRDDAKRVAERMMGRIKQPIIISGTKLSISVSIGISVFPDHGTSKEALLMKADQALYEAKKKGRKCIEVFE